MPDSNSRPTWSPSCAKQGYDVVDVGAADVRRATTTIRPTASPPARGWSADPGSLGVVIGGSGNGEQIAANKVAGVRAALAWNLTPRRWPAQHNDANVVGIGARQHTLDEATASGHGVSGDAVLRGIAAPAPHRPGRARTRTSTVFK